jgi:hemolysin activation/secretion protein
VGTKGEFCVNLTDIKFNFSLNGSVHLVPFFDWGWVENTDRPTPDPRTISSLGLGLRWDPSSNTHADIYWGYALRKVDNPNNDLQDHGFHFQLFINFF